MFTLCLAGCCVVALAAVSHEKASQKDTPSPVVMAKAAQEFLDALRPEQRAVAALPFDEVERFNWAYVPRDRKGLPLKAMEEAQRWRAQALLHAGLSQKGMLKAETIMSLERVLADIEKGSGPTRDPERYFFTVFGAPSKEKNAAPWGWRVEGHHISLNFTMVNGALTATTPQFLGANPAEVRQGPMKGTRALHAEEDLARDLLHSLDDAQRKAALLSPDAPGDIITANARKVDLAPLTPAKGVSHAEMTPAQRAKLFALLEEYARAMPDDLAHARMERLRKAGLDAIRFAWAGGVERGQPHYYRAQGPTFLIEYDNTQNDANHIHSVWRDFQGDWGEDLLLAHYQHGHHAPEP